MDNIRVQTEYKRLMKMGIDDKMALVLALGTCGKIDEAVQAMQSEVENTEILAEETYSALAPLTEIIELAKQPVERDDKPMFDQEQ